MGSLPLPGEVPVGTPAPGFTLPVSGGGDQMGGLPPQGARGLTLVAFFKETCPTCRLTFPLLERIHRKAGPSGGRVVGISQDGPEGAARFVAEMGLTFPILIDGPDYPVSRLYGLVAVPSLYLVDAFGRILVSGAGFARAELSKMSDDLARSVGAPAFPLYEEAESFPAFKPG